jgi:hypothetical protein
MHMQTASDERRGPRFERSEQPNDGLISIEEPDANADAAVGPRGSAGNVSMLAMAAPTEVASSWTRLCRLAEAIASLSPKNDEIFRGIQSREISKRSVLFTPAYRKLYGLRRGRCCESGEGCGLIRDRGVGPRY